MKIEAGDFLDEALDVSESASAEFSFFYTKRSSSNLYIQTYRALEANGLCREKKSPKF
jgi:hypothetical protein